jgi:hypothetical protein
MNCEIFYGKMILIYPQIEIFQLCTLKSINISVQNLKLHLSSKPLLLGLKWMYDLELLQ